MSTAFINIIIFLSSLPIPSLCFFSISEYNDEVPHLLSMTPSGMEMLKIDGEPIYVETAAQPEVFATREGGREILRMLVNETKVRARIHNKIEQSYNGDGCFCELYATTDTCTNGWFTRKQVTTDRRKLAIEKWECDAACLQHHWRGQKVFATADPQKFEDQKQDPADSCPSKPWSNTELHRSWTLEIATTKVKVSADKKVAQFDNNGLKTECSVDSGMCLGVNAVLSVDEKSLKSIECSHEPAVFEPCRLRLPLKSGKLCPVVSCYTSGEEHELTGESQLIASCAGGGIGQETTSGDIIQFRDDPLRHYNGNFCTGAAATAGSKVEFELHDTILELLSLVDQLESQINVVKAGMVNANETCPDLEHYMSGPYAINRLPGVTVGKPVAAVKSYWLDTKLNKSSIKVRFLQGHHMKEGFVSIGSRIITARPCGPRLPIAGFSVNLSHSFVVTPDRYTVLAKGKLQTEHWHLVSSAVAPLTNPMPRDRPGVPYLDLPEVFHTIQEEGLLEGWWDKMRKNWELTLLMLLLFMGSILVLILQCSCWARVFRLVTQRRRRRNSIELDSLA